MQPHKTERVEIDYSDCPNRLVCSHMILDFYAVCEYLADAEPDTDVLFMVDKDWPEWCDEWPFFSFAPMYFDQKGALN